MADVMQDVKNSLELLKKVVIDIEDYFIYDSSVAKVTLGDDDYFVCADDDAEALDKVIDHLEDTNRHKEYVYDNDEIETFDDIELQNLTCVGNHCYYLKVPYDIEYV